MPNSSKAIPHFPPRISEWTTAAILFNWSILVYATNGEILLPEYINMQYPLVWGVAFLILSMLRMAVLYINGRLRRSPHLRSGLSFLSCFAWFQITLAFIGAGALTTALAVYPVLLFLDFYNAYRIAIEARITDEGYRDAGTA